MAYSHDNLVPPVLVVEDDQDFREMVVLYLNRHGITADGVGSTSAYRRLRKGHRCHIAILDVGLPDGDGLELARELLAESSVGVIITSGMGRVADRTRGYQSGADAYLVKPVDLTELLAVLKSVARRLPIPKSQLWHYDRITWCLTNPERNSIILTRSEACIIEALAEFPGSPVARDNLVSALGYPVNAYDHRRMEVLVRRLRRKAKECLGSSLPLETVRGKGYAFRAPITVVSPAVSSDRS